MEKEKPLFEIQIDAPSLKKGHISVPLLLQICDDAQKAVKRQADAIEGRVRKTTETDRKEQRELTLELIALRKGSTVLDFAESPSDQMNLPYLEEQQIGLEAASTIADVLASANRKRGEWREPVVPEVLEALDDMGRVLTAGVISFKWIVPRQNGAKRRTAQFNGNTVTRIRQRRHELAVTKKGVTAQTNGTTSTTVSESFLEGMLEVADGKCRIEPVLGPPLTVTFGADQAPKVLEALHRPVRAKIDERSRRLVDISVRDEGDMDRDLFFESKSIDELIAEQGVVPISSLEALSGAIPDEDLDEFVTDIYTDRQNSTR